MMLGQKQKKFMRMQSVLLTYVHSLGYEVTQGRGHVPGAKVKSGKLSCHHYKLAVDLNLFKEGKYLTPTEAHRIFGIFWEAMGGTWGGRFNDGNHYSLEHNGVR